MLLRERVFQFFINDIKDGRNEMKAILYDNGLREELLRITTTLLSVTHVVNVYDLIRLKNILERYSYKLRRFNFIISMNFGNLPAIEYKQYWLSKYNALVDELMKDKEQFMKLIVSREGVNSLMELYYNTVVKLMMYIVANIRHYKTKIASLARDDKNLEALVSTANDMLFILSYPLILYEEGRKVDYDVVSLLIGVLSTIKDMRDVSRVQV